MYQIQRVWNSHILASNARLVRSSWYNRERSIWPDILHHLEIYAMHTLSLFSCFFTLNQIKSIICSSLLFHSLLLPSWTSEKIRPWARGLRLMRLKTIGRGRGGHPWWAHPYSSWLSSIIASNAIAGQWRVIRSECIRNASVTPKNTEYTKYDPPGAQVSDDALAQKYLLYTPPAQLKRKI